MAHEVQIESVRIKIRAPWQILVFGWLTSGIYVAYWFYVTTRTMEQFDRAANRGAAGINALPAMIVGFVATGGFWLGSITWAIANARRNADAVAGLPPGTSSSTMSLMSTTLLVIGFIATLIVAGMMRGMALRIASSAGLLPEERTPSGFAHWAATIVLFRLFGPSTAALSVQTTLNAAWEQYPRYFASLGATREQVAADATSGPGSARARALAQTQGTSVQGTPTRAEPAPVQQLPATTAPVVLAAMPSQVPPPAQQQQQLSPAAQHMLQLEPLAQAGTMTPAQAFEYAQAAEQVHGPQAAAPWYAYVLQVDPTNVLAAYWYGVFQLGQSDDAGIVTLHGAMGDLRTDAHARSQVVAYLGARGRHEEAARYQPPATGRAA